LILVFAIISVLNGALRLCSSGRWHSVFHFDVVWKALRHRAEIYTMCGPPQSFAISDLRSSKKKNPVSFPHRQTKLEIKVPPLISILMGSL